MVHRGLFWGFLREQEQAMTPEMQKGCRIESREILQGFHQNTWISCPADASIVASVPCLTARVVNPPGTALNAISEQGAPASFPMPDWFGGRELRDDTCYERVLPVAIWGIRAIVRNIKFGRARRRL